MLLPAPPVPPAAAEPVWASRPTDAEVREAAALYATVTSRAGAASMTCLVRDDGRLDVCGVEAGPDLDPAFSVPLRRLRDRWRVEVRPGGPAQVRVRQTFPKLVDSDPVLAHAPSPAEEAAANPRGIRGRAHLRCTLSVAGRLEDCGPGLSGEGETSDPAAVEIARAVASSYRFAPARLAGRPVATPRLLSVRTMAEGDTPAAWLRKPDGHALGAAWPAQAAKRGVDGRAVVSCRIRATGVLTRCEVIDEQPLGLGYAYAALSLIPLFVMKPPTRDGKPVDDGAVVIPINWKGAGGGGYAGGETVHVAQWLPFVRTPSVEDVRRAYPAAAAAGRRGGAVTFQCRVKPDGALACEEALGQEPGSPFAGAARRLTALFRVDATGAGRETLQHLRVLLTVRFSPEVLDPSAVRVVKAPDWLRQPDADLARSAFPALATAKHVAEGRATVECVVGGDGRLGGCHALRQEPDGLGFGAAAEAMAAAMQMNPWTRDGEPAAGMHVRFPLRMLKPEADATPTAPAS